MSVTLETPRLRRGRTNNSGGSADTVQDTASPTVREANRNVGVRLIELPMLERVMPWIEKTIVLSTTKVETQDGLFLKAAVVRGLERLEETLVILEQASEAQPSGPLAPRLRSTIVEVQALAAQAGP